MNPRVKEIECLNTKTHPRVFREMKILSKIFPIACKNIQGISTTQIYSYFATFYAHILLLNGEKKFIFIKSSEDQIQSMNPNKYFYYANRL